MSDHDFTCEYAKSNRSKCKVCKDTINKDELRLAQMVKSDKFDGKIPIWHHVKCFFARDNKGLTNWNMLHNGYSLRPADQQSLKKMIEEKAGDADASQGTKRKPEDDAAEEASSSKKAKVEAEPEKSEEEKALEEETNLLWEIKDQLKKHCSNAELRVMLENNNQPSNGGEQQLLQRCANGMLFGALPKCPECKDGNLRVENGVYKCSASTAWGKCLWEAESVEPKPWKISKELKKGNTYLTKFKFVPRKKVLVKRELMKRERTEGEEEEAATSSSGTVRRRPFHEIGEVTATPLAKMTIALAGTLSESQDALKKLIEELGGTFSKEVEVRVTHLISTPGEINKGKSKITKAVKYDIPILSEQFLKDANAEGKKLDLTKYLIGGSDEAQQKLKFLYSDPASAQKMEEKEKKVKLVMKGRAAVDPLAGEDAVKNYHVLDDGGTALYNVVLNLADLSTGTNSYYALQVLESDRKDGSYAVFRKWGRVGTSRGGTKLEKFSSKFGAVANFEELYLDKTGNAWANRDIFQKKPNKFFPVEIDYGEEKKKELSKNTVSTSKSKLDVRVQDLITKIFDIKLMEESLLSMEIDLKKMPLGKLSKRHIQSGYGVLKQIADVLQKLGGEAPDRRAEGELLALTNQFYTLIPHDFGNNPPRRIDNEEYLKEKMQMMEALIDIEIATSLINQDNGADEAESPIDINYQKLKTDLRPLEHDSDDFQMIQTYMKNQQGRFNLKLDQVFKVARENEEDRFNQAKALGNRHLLWHGSRLTNYVGILSQGLRIAPPEAPTTGYRFGKGVYFADICEKSAGYCFGNKGGTILMMLCEVALGQPKELLRDQYMEKPIPPSNSTKAVGGIAPNETKVLPDGTVVPLGKPSNTGIRSSCTHNEYIVYNINQVCIRYLLQVTLC